MIDLFNTLVKSQKLPIFARAGEPYNELLARIALQADSDVIVIGGMGLKHDDYLRPLRRQITVNTVDAFQGQERDVILVSLVRANEAGQIGFLSDLRRMNVAITRARSKLILIGSGETLGHHRFYRELYKRCAVE